MAEAAYDHLVGEFCWLGFELKYALKLAGLRYPNEELIYDPSNEFFEHYEEAVMDLWSHKYEELDAEDGYSNHKKIAVYIDGANLLRSFAFVKESKQEVDGLIESEVSIKLANYQTPRITENYPVWYIMLVLVEALQFEKARVGKVTFVMCADDLETETLLMKIRTDFGFDVIIPEKTGEGLKSSANEDKVLKELIKSDLNNNHFDIAIIATGDGNNKDGTSFPEIARSIEHAGKQVIFTGFDLTTSKKIKEHFEFVDLVDFTSFPRSDKPQIFSRKR